MGQRRQPKRKKPLGKPLPPFTDAEIEITDEDIEQARLWAEKYGDDTLLAMWDAEPVDEGFFE